MITKGNNLADAFPLVFSSWLINMFCFLAVFWVGDYLIIERGWLWVIDPKIGTLWTLGIAKFVLSILLFITGGKRFGVIFN